ncbi:oligosaccharide flippase family protein [Bacillus luti]|uniref:oligosaccharide flippase family protein n=1 Tax=Bacillus luti TaxID=2026191 RepID=UPI003D64F0D2
MRKQGSLIKLFLGFAVGPLGAAVINFLTLPIITWLINPEEFGKTSLFLLMQTLAIAVVFLGMDHAYVREYNDIKNKKELLLNSIIFPLSASIVIGIMLLLFSGQITSIFLKGQSQVVIMLFAIWLPFITLERFLLLSIRMEEKGLLYSIFSILVKIMIMIFTLIFLLFWSRSYIAVIFANVVGQVISNVVLIIYCKNRLEFNLHYLNKDLLRQMFKFGIPFIVTALLMWMLNSTDRIVLEKVSSYDELGVYFAALKVIGVLAIFQNIFSTFWLPVAYKWKKEKVDNKEFDKISRYIAFIMSFVFISILLFKEIFIYILSAEYSKVVDIIPFLLFYPIMYTLGETTGLGISFSRKTHHNIWISLVLAAINLVLNIILVPEYGALGAAIALGITYILYFWIRTLVSRILWYKFDLTYYFILTIILIVVATGNIMLDDNNIIFNIISMVILLIFNYNTLKIFYQNIKMKNFNKLTIKQ